MIERIRNAWRALFARNPRVTIEVIGGTWSAQWEHMGRDEAALLLHGVAEAVDHARFAQAECSATVH